MIINHYKDNIFTDHIFCYTAICPVEVTVSLQKQASLNSSLCDFVFTIM